MYIIALIMELYASISISQIPGKIWNFWTPVTTDVQWRDGIIKAEWTSDPPYGIGSTGLHYHEKYGAMPWTVTKIEDGRHIEWIHNQESILKGSVAFYHVDPENGGSRVSIYTNIKGSPLMRIIMIFMKGRMTESLKADLRRLKEIMEK